MRPAARAATIALALIAVQGLIVLAYLGVQRARRPDPTFASTPLAPAPAPPLLVERPDGTAHDVAAGRGRVRLVHFWATWCEPCRTELPALLAGAAEVGDLDLVAVSVDDDWDVVRAFFPRGLPREVVRARDREAHRRYGARTLPDTYVVAPDGRVIERIAGARDWSRPAARRYLEALPRRGGVSAGAPPPGAPDR